MKDMKSLLENSSVEMKAYNDLPEGMEPTGVVVLPRIGAWLSIQFNFGDKQYIGFFRVTLQNQLQE